MNKIGPNTDPCGTPQSTELGKEVKLLLVDTDWVLEDKYDWIHDNALLSIP